MNKLPSQIDHLLHRVSRNQPLTYTVNSNSFGTIKELLNSLVLSCILNDFQLTIAPGGVSPRLSSDSKLDLNTTGHSCHCPLSPFTGIGLAKDVQIMVTNLQNLHLSKEQMSSKDHNGENNQWH